MAGEHRGQIDGAWTFCAIEAPDALDCHWIHIHRFRAIAPARRDSQCDINAGLFELICTSGCFCHTTNRGIGNNDLHRLTVRIAEVLLEQFLGGLSHAHGLFL